jgi:hypothetical protein
MASARNRGLVWLIAFAAALSLAVAVAGFRDWLPDAFALFGTFAFLACMVLIVVVGWRTRQETIAQRDAAGRGQMILIAAAQLCDEDTATLELISRRDSLDGEAARLILQRRMERERAPKA